MTGGAYAEAVQVSYASQTDRLSFVPSYAYHTDLDLLVLLDQDASFLAPFLAWVYLAL